MDEMHGSLIAYVMRIEKDKSIDKEATFKVKNKTKAIPKFYEEEIFDEMEAKFVCKLNKGTKGKYKLKLQFKYFNYGGVGHFAMKYPYNKKGKGDESSHRERSGWKIKSNFRKGNFKKKSFISKNISSSKARSNEDS